MLTILMADVNILSAVNFAVSMYIVGAHRNNAITLYLNNQLIPCVNKFKYLGINFIAKRTLTVDTASIKRKFYAACNSVLV